VFVPNKGALCLFGVYVVAIAVVFSNQTIVIGRIKNLATEKRAVGVESESPKSGGWRRIQDTLAVDTRTPNSGVRATPTTSASDGTC
jgi:hypothetical protein